MALAVLALLVVLMPIMTGLDFLLRRFLRDPRLIYRLNVRLLIRANPALTQPMTATVDEGGVRVQNVSGEMQSGWSMHPLHVETDRSFVLLASRGRGAAVLVLPKRGLAGADPAPLRALLAAHSRRLG
ncbi:YcxB family protein [Plantactinospora sp. CA-294935]|uniref:YcxB family protein n=1 Tax=Plantactinospora sp. CA-294935 TaxID=3240012 RepID=UPI003D90B3F2